jgi:hypothetical protein
MGLATIFNSHAWEENMAIVTKPSRCQALAQPKLLQLVYLVTLDPDPWVLRDASEERRSISQVKSTLVCGQRSYPGDKTVNIPPSVDPDAWTRKAAF